MFVVFVRFTFPFNVSNHAHIWYVTWPQWKTSKNSDWLDRFRNIDIRFAKTRRYLQLAVCVWGNVQYFENYYDRSLSAFIASFMAHCRARSLAHWRKTLWLNVHVDFEVFLLKCALQYLSHDSRFVCNGLWESLESGGCPGSPTSCPLGAFLFLGNLVSSMVWISVVLRCEIRAQKRLNEVSVRSFRKVLTSWQSTYKKIKKCHKRLTPA